MPEPSAWRVDNKRWEARSFDGTGASLEGGRWNSSGVPVVYASEHLAMAAQEIFVHLPRPLPRSSRYVKFGIRFGGLAMTRLEPSELPPDWRAEPVPGSTQRIGDAWVAAAKTAILAVPSVLYPEETNFVLNPAHPDFSKIRISAAEPFAFDPRMARLVEPTQPGVSSRARGAGRTLA
jgi:RES domain-containing protein